MLTVSGLLEQLGRGPIPAGSSVFSGGAVPATTQVAFSNGTTLAGDAGLTATGTAAARQLTVGAGTGAPILLLDGATSNSKTLRYGTAGSKRWDFGPNAVAEGGANAGSNLVLTAYDDAGTVIDFPMSCVRAASGALTIARPLTVSNTVSATVTDAVTAAATTVGSFLHATSGTAANGFGTAIQFQGFDDGGTQRVLANLTATWTTAASATRASKLAFNVNVATVVTTAFTLASTSATFASGFPVTISDATAATNISTGALIVAGGAGFSGTIYSPGFVTSTSASGSIASQNTRTTQIGTGAVAFWRSGGTIGSTGDMVLQSDLAQDCGFVFRAGITTPATVATINAAFPAATTPGFVTAGNSLIAGAVTDGYTSSHRLTPTYTGAFTVTRHNYMDLNTPTLASSAVCTDAAVFRFDAAPGTHKALAADASVAVTFTSLGPTGAQTTIQGWMKINVNGTLRYIPFW